MKSNCKDNKSLALIVKVSQKVHNIIDYFVDDKGKRPFQKDVFNAFGAMLGEDFSDHDKDLVKILKGKTREEQIKKLFDELSYAAKTFTQD